MEDSYFVLRDAKPMAKNQGYYCIPGCKDEMQNKMDQIRPTPVSIENRHLEWIIPNTVFNQNWISLHYKHMTVLEAGQEQTLSKSVTPMPGMPKPMGPQSVQKLIKKKKSKPIPPNVRKKLKSEISEKLLAQGIEIPQGATLKDLQELEKAAA